MDDDNNTTMDTASLAGSNVLLLADKNDTIIVDFDFGSFDAAGFTLTGITNPPTVRTGWGVAFEKEAVVGGRKRAMVCG